MIRLDKEWIVASKTFGEAMEDLQEGKEGTRVISFKGKKYVIIIEKDQLFIQPHS